MKTCTSCGAQFYRAESKFCSKCGSGLPAQENEPHINICTNPSCNYHKTKFIYPDDLRFCDICGAKTVYAQ